MYYIYNTLFIVLYIIKYISYDIKYYNGTVLHKRYNVMRYHSGTNGFAYQAEIIVHLLNLKKSLGQNFLIDKILND